MFEKINLLPANVNFVNGLKSDTLKLPASRFSLGIAMLLNSRSVTMKINRLLVSKKELKLLGVPYSFQHIARLEKAGEFPKRVQLGACRVAWVYEEVCEWIN